MPILVHSLLRAGSAAPSEAIPRTPNTSATANSTGLDAGFRDMIEPPRDANAAIIRDRSGLRPRQGMAKTRFLFPPGYAIVITGGKGMNTMRARTLVTDR